MAFKELPSTGIDGEYWTPLTIGTEIEGNIIEFREDNYGHDRIVLELSNEEEITLPSHSDLRQYNNKLNIGDYIRVTLSNIKKSNNPDYADKNIYKVEVDPDQYVEYEDQEEL